MHRDCLQQITTRFAGFAAAYAEAADASADMKQKVGHSRRVAVLCAEFALESGWPEGECTAVQALGLLHDVGRFVQLAEHGTFDDALSVDHGRLGVEVIARQGLLCGYAGADAGAILFAVAEHNQRHLTPSDDARAGRYLRLLRDADKVDIMATFGETIRQGRTGLYPQMFAGRDPGGAADAGLMRQVGSREVGSYERIQSLSDVVLVGLSWVHDINTLPALRCIRARGLLDGFEGLLGSAPGALEILRSVHAEIDRRLEQRSE